MLGWLWSSQLGLLVVGLLPPWGLAPWDVEHKRKSLHFTSGVLCHPNVAKSLTVDTRR